MEQEPIDTSTPWHRPRSEPISLVEAQVKAERAAYERAARRAMTRPGKGKIHRMSLVADGYEPNRAMAPEPESLIAKKGMKPPGADEVEVTKWDKLVVYSVITCIVLMLSILGYVAIKLG